MFIYLPALKDILYLCKEEQNDRAAMDAICQNQGIRQTLSSRPLQALVYALMEEVEVEQKRLNKINRFADSHGTIMQKDEDLQALLHVHAIRSSITSLGVRISSERIHHSTSSNEIDVCLCR